MEPQIATVRARRQWLRGLAALPLVPIAGCVVAPYGPYYRPSASLAGVQPRKAWCQGRTGPDTGLLADLEGLQLSVRSEIQSRVAPPSLLVTAELTLPPGRSLQWLGQPRLLVEGRPPEVPVQVSARRTQAVAAGQWVDPAALRPGTAGRDPAAPHGTVSVRPAAVAGLPPRVAVEGLVMEFDSGRWALPATEVTRPASRTLPDFYRSEAQQAELRSRADACRRDTPKEACDNIAEFGSDSHAGRSQLVAWRGRWYLTSRPPQQFEGEMTLLPLREGRWRLSDTAWLVRVPGAAAMTPLRASQVRLSFDDRLEAGHRVGAAGVETLVRIEAQLPPDVPAVELLLPAFVSDGRRVQPTPIRFERRTFDGGAQPFNC